MMMKKCIHIVRDHTWEAVLALLPKIKGVSHLYELLNCSQIYCNHCVCEYDFCYSSEAVNYTIPPCVSGFDSKNVLHSHIYCLAKQRTLSYTHVLFTRYTYSNKILCGIYFVFIYILFSQPNP
jgi:hypothetical protein